MAFVHRDQRVGGLQLGNDDGREAKDQARVDGSDVGDEGGDHLAQSLAPLTFARLALDVGQRHRDALLVGGHYFGQGALVHEGGGFLPEGGGECVELKSLQLII